LTDDVKWSYSRHLGNAAIESVLAEIKTAPKPGLVDPLGNGSHTDMDWHTFVRSAEAIAPYWKHQAFTGLCNTAPEAALSKLRATGVEMEKAMFDATNGINTHKGLIYLLSLLLYGAGLCICRETELTPENIAAFASSAVKGTVERELAPLRKGCFTNKLTHGEKLFLNYGVTGIRGEAEKGFPSMIRFGLPEFKRVIDLGGTPNDASLSALLAIMESLEDSNVIHRGGYNFWLGRYRSIIHSARSDFDPLAGDYTALEKLENIFLPLRISPGGAADLLGCTIFMYNLAEPTCQQ
jgi:triphosphoribosyl-dephospho-CoA synthetase